VHNTSIVRIWGEGIDVVVRGEDWVLIDPYLKDGSFNTLIVPVPPKPRNPSLKPDTATIDTDDPELYNRVLGVLQGLFPDDYPTSKL
jgi:hypothetical protein